MKPWHIIVVLIVIIVIFGAAKLPDIARSLGQSAKVLKKEMRELQDDVPPGGYPAPPQPGQYPQGYSAQPLQPGFGQPGQPGQYPQEPYPPQQYPQGQYPPQGQPYVQQPGQYPQADYPQTDGQWQTGQNGASGQAQPGQSPQQS